MKSISIISVIVLSLLLTSCFKEDDIVDMDSSSELEKNIIEIGEDYSNQIFYNIDKNEVTASVKRDAWDLAFDNRDGEWNIIVNYAKMMLAGNTSDTNFANISSEAGLDMNFDPSDGSKDNLAIGEWYDLENGAIKSKSYVYVIDRGQGLDYNNLGKKKIQIDVSGDNYIIRYADLDGGNYNKIEIARGTESNYTYFSFNTNSIVNIAPHKDDWTIQFTRYTTMLESNGEDYPYFVTGVLLNPNNVKAALDSVDFAAITLSDTAFYSFSNTQDIIGYDWKYYSFDDEMYSIRENRNYIIRNNNGMYYKLRFISFYDNLGRKGSVNLEILKL